MKSKNFWGMALIGMLVLGSSIGAVAQDPKTETFSGEINSYSPQLTSSTGSVTGPYEVRGPWSLTLTTATNTANFSAALNMELSDGWALTQNGGDFDPAARAAHTHHITLTNAHVTPITGGFKVTGTARVTLNGARAPISPSPVEVDITGGSIIPYSNITMTFALPASNHFGTEALAGVVRNVQKDF
jgi:hypothetical protein